MDLGNFDGNIYRLVDNWFKRVPVNDYKNRPINYLEIGTMSGSSIISFAKTYGLHSDTKMYCIDPWEDYNDYPEYKNELQTAYEKFLKNVENSGVKDKIIVKRGYSHTEVPKLEDDFFDIIYNLLLFIHQYLHFSIWKFDF
jgi:hypothetical protein